MLFKSYSQPERKWFWSKNSCYDFVTLKNAPFQKFGHPNKKLDTFFSEIWELLKNLGTLFKNLSIIQKFKHHSKICGTLSHSGGPLGHPHSPGP